MLYAIVQHSGMGYRKDTTFELGVETRTVTTKADANRVKAAGGVLFEDYAAAEAFCDKAAYPAGYEGLVPRVGGSFSDVEVDGLKIYIPLVEIKG